MVLAYLFDFCTFLCNTSHFFSIIYLYRWSTLKRTGLEVYHTRYNDNILFPSNFPLPITHLHLVMKMCCVSTLMRSAAGVESVWIFWCFLWRPSSESWVSVGFGCSAWDLELRVILAVAGRTVRDLDFFIPETGVQHRELFPLFWIKAVFLFKCVHQINIIPLPLPLFKKLLDWNDPFLLGLFAQRETEMF